MKGAMSILSCVAFIRFCYVAAASVCACVDLPPIAHFLSSFWSVDSKLIDSSFSSGTVHPCSRV